MCDKLKDTSVIPQLANQRIGNTDNVIVLAVKWIVLSPAWLLYNLIQDAVDQGTKTKSKRVFRIWLTRVNHDDYVVCWVIWSGVFVLFAGCYFLIRHAISYVK